MLFLQENKIIVISSFTLTEKELLQYMKINVSKLIKSNLIKRYVLIVLDKNKKLIWNIIKNYILKVDRKSVIYSKII